MGLLTDMFGSVEAGAAALGLAGPSTWKGSVRTWVKWKRSCWCYRTRLCVRWTKGWQRSWDKITRSI